MGAVLFKLSSNITQNPLKTFNVSRIAPLPDLLEWFCSLSHSAPVDAAKTTEMNAFLCLILGLLATATLCQGGCFKILRDSSASKFIRGCKTKDGVLHRLGSKWNDKDCNKCTCNKLAITCCAQISQYFGLPESCKVVVNKDCTHKLVNRSGPDSVCVPKGAVL
ncbi:beta-microseminoprotein-like [Polypterus senegalus]|uniref:beta-microseminoprotein-like n=1 Tax=Polypterus senegalus TaxID=55291 RepID=UPI001965DF61|nr:beta-microseminoprotein-like [Polypterus senegalus]